MKIRTLMLGSLAAAGLGLVFAAPAYASPPDPIGLGMSPGIYDSDNFGGVLLDSGGLDSHVFVLGQPALHAKALTVADVMFTIELLDFFDVDPAASAGCDPIIDGSGETVLGFDSGGGHLYGGPACALGIDTVASISYVGLGKTLGAPLGLPEKALGEKQFGSGLLPEWEILAVGSGHGVPG